MADVRCPMCGKPNPAELEICQYCQARLRPIWETGAPQDSGTAGAGQPAPDPADWLRALGGSDELPAESHEPAPDWLAGQGDEPLPPDRGELFGRDDASARPLDDLGGETPDWLSRLGFQEEETGAAARDLSSMVGKPSEPGGRAELGDDDATAWADFAKDSGLPEPDWLKENPPSEDWHTPTGDDLPDWLKSPQEALDRAGEANAPDAGDELPDWLKASDETGEQVSEERPPRVSDEAFPDWQLDAVSDIPEADAFSADTFSAGVFAAPEEEVPPASTPQSSDQFAGWMDARWEAPEKPAAGAEDDEEEEDLPLPDWFAQGPDENAPDWLRAAMQEQPGDAPQPEEAPPAPAEQPPAVQPPAWLSELGGSAGAPAPEPAAGANEPGGEDEEDFAAWIASVGATDDAAKTSQPSAEPGELDWLTSAGDTPSWLQEFSGETPAESAPEEPERPTWLPSGEDAGAAVFSPPPDTSEWMASVGAEADRLQASDDALPPEDDTYDLSWVETLEANYPGMMLETDEETGGFGTPAESFAADDGLAPGDLPSWLSGENIETELGQAVEPAAESGLNPGELPGWLMGMRPESLPGAEEETAAAPGFEQVEGAGPLAGLRGVLPAEPDIAQAEKPPTYSVLLQVTDAQNLQAKMLADLVAAETEAPAREGAAAVRSQFALRLAFTILLAAALLFSILTGQPYAYRPAPPAELTAVMSLIDGLESGAPVLIALDYEPGYSAEMDAAARAALGHLLRVNAAPALISTLPTGPLQIERLMGEVGAAENRTLSAGAEYSNLGFVSGGALALASLADAPTAPGAAGLRGAVDLSAYRMVIVATADPDKARSWIEQVAGSLDNTPLVMILSAQAEPMVRPYYNPAAGPVRGMLTGLTGAVIYETNTAQRGGAVRDWPPFNVGLALAITLMLVGAVYNLLSGRLAPRKPTVEVKDS